MISVPFLENGPDIEKIKEYIAKIIAFMALFAFHDTQIQQAIHLPMNRLIKYLKPLNQIKKIL